MDPATALILVQTGVSIVRSLLDGRDPTPEQQAFLDQAESAIKAQLDADLAKIAGVPGQQAQL